MALNEDVEVENDIDTSPVLEAQATEDTEPEATESAEEGVEGEVETGEEPKKGYSSRVRELNTRAKEAEAKAESLAEKLRTLSAQPEETPRFAPQTKDDSPLVMPGEEIDAVEFDKRLRTREQRILQQADALVTLRGKQNEAIARINNEAEKTLKTYPELDPDNETFNKDLSDAVSEATEAYVLRNPYSASVTKFVDKMMRPYKGAVSKEVGEQTATLAKQVSEAATKPTSVRAKEKPATEKSIAELEAELGVVQA